MWVWGSTRHCKVSSSTLHDLSRRRLVCTVGVGEAEKRAGPAWQYRLPAKGSRP